MSKDEPQHRRIIQGWTVRRLESVHRAVDSLQYQLFELKETVERMEDYMRRAHPEYDATFCSNCGYRFLSSWSTACVQCGTERTTS